MITNMILSTFIGSATTIIFASACVFAPFIVFIGHLIGRLIGRLAGKLCP